MNAAYPSIGQGISTGMYPQSPSPPRDVTALEQHLNSLCTLVDNLAKASQRAERMADKFFGCEPTPIGKNDCAAAGEPPMIARIEERLRVAADLSESIHRHLNRLERL